MSLPTKPHRLFLLMFLLVCVEANVKTEGPAAGVISESRTEEKDSLEDRDQPRPHLTSYHQDDEPPVKNDIQKQAYLHKDPHDDKQEEAAEDHQNPLEDIHNAFSELYVERTHQDKLNVPPEDTKHSTQISADVPPEDTKQHRTHISDAPPENIKQHSTHISDVPPEDTKQHSKHISDVPPEDTAQHTKHISAEVPIEDTTQQNADISADVSLRKLDDDDTAGDLPPLQYVPGGNEHLNPEVEHQHYQDQQLMNQPMSGASIADSPPDQGSSDASEVSVGPDEDETSFSEKIEEEKPLSAEELEGERFFQAGEKLINATYYKEYKEAYLNFLQASELNHTKAKEYLAFGYLFGDYLPQNVSRAAELFNSLASLGSPKAQMGLAFMYSAGLYYNSSQAKALIYLTFGALGGDPLAQMALGYRYYAGIGVESKCETALTYYRKVATKVADMVTLSGGPVVQRIRLQEETESQGTNNGPLLDDDLLQYYHFLADKGDQQAQVVLGTLYYQGGKGVQINHEQAYHYFSTAAESGSGHALGYLGKMHSEGSPVVTQSNHTAFEYFKKSADKNNHIGQTGLGMMYLNGLGIEKDTSKAFRYFSLASDQGSVDAQLQLGIMYFAGNGVRKDYKMAVKYFTMSSQNGHVLAFYNLAQMHATGTGVLRNCHTAVELFKNVAERGRWSEMLMDAHRMYHEGSVDAVLVKYMFLAELGYEVAQSNVAYMLDSGVSSKFGSYETQQRALLQYSRAASQGSTHARLKMGDYHYYGLGTEVDYESAATHYRMASEQQHNAQAMFNLGYMHEMGLGLKQDVHLAKRFYDMAAETSLDAHVPVTLALLKLGVFYGMDVFGKEFEGVSGLFGLMDPVAYLGPEWDLYLASVLAILFGILFFLRRMR